MQSERSELQDILHEYFVKTHVGQMVFYILTSTVSSNEEGSTDYISDIFVILLNGSMYPLLILSPTLSRIRDFGCFEIWDGVYDTKSSLAFMVVWIVFFSIVGGYVWMNILWCGFCCCRGNDEDSTFNKYQKYFHIFLTFALFGLIFGTFISIYAVSIVEKIVQMKAIISIILSGINLPRSFEVCQALAIDHVPLTAPTLTFLFFQIGNAIYFVGFLLMMIVFIMDRSGAEL